MAGVIDDRGVQWERCNACASWVAYDNLGYEVPTAAHPHGRDSGIRTGSVLFDNVRPAARWQTYEVE